MLGILNFVVWLPLKDIAEAIQGLIGARGQLFDDFYQLSGISDIMRGASEAQELGVMLATAISHLRMFEDARQPLIYAAGAGGVLVVLTFHEVLPATWRRPLAYWLEAVLALGLATGLLVLTGYAESPFFFTLIVVAVAVAVATVDNFRIITKTPDAYGEEPLQWLWGLFSTTINIRDKFRYIG
jgi:hypothetical protein